MSLRGDAFDFSFKLVEDEAANDSDKALTVPAGKLWKVMSIYVELATTATTGNRTMLLEIRDSADDIVYRINIRDVIAASATKYLLFAPSSVWLDDYGGTQTAPLPNPCIIPAGYDIHIYDSAAIDAAADDMEVHMLVQEVDA
ncbi:MAG: hypothetical protein ACE5JU_20650 [Candidatus Binatia bacterium]